jgi:hypothetical protein
VDSGGGLGLTVREGANAVRGFRVGDSGTSLFSAFRVGEREGVDEAEGVGVGVGETEGVGVGVGVGVSARARPDATASHSIAPAAPPARTNRYR